MAVQRLSSDIISTLPEEIIESVLTRMPIRDALRTSVLSRRWWYCWMSMPKVSFNEQKLFEESINDKQMKKYKLLNAVFHVLLLYKGPILDFRLYVGELDMASEFDQIIVYLSRSNHVKKLAFEILTNHYWKLPSLFFTLQGLEYLEITNCVFEPPLTFKWFNRLSEVYFIDVEVSAKSLLRFLSNCPLLEVVGLIKYENTSKEEMSGMPQKLPISLVRLKRLYLDVCLMEKCVFSFALRIIRSFQNLELIEFEIYDDEKLHDRQTSMNLLDLQNDSSLSLDHLKIFNIIRFRNSPFEIEFVKLILAKSPVLKKLTIELSCKVFVDDEVTMLRDLILAPLPRASPSAKLIFIISVEFFVDASIVLASQGLHPVISVSGAWNSSYVISSYPENTELSSLHMWTRIRWENHTMQLNFTKLHIFESSINRTRHCSASCFVIVSSLFLKPNNREPKPPSELEQELQYWLRFIVSNSKKAGQQCILPNVTVVLTHYDKIDQSSVNFQNIVNVVQNLRDKFQGYLDFYPTVFTVDARSSAYVNKLTHHLKKISKTILQSVPRVYELCNDLVTILSDWRLENDDKRVMKWEEFSNLCQVKVSSLRLVKLNVKKVSVNDGVSGGFVSRKELEKILRGNLQSQIPGMGPKVFENLNVTDLVNIMLKLELCYKQDPFDHGSLLLIQLLLEDSRTRTPIWQLIRSDSEFVGRHLECHDSSPIFLTPGFFPRLQHTWTPVSDSSRLVLNAGFDFARELLSDDDFKEVLNGRNHDLYNLTLELQVPLENATMQENETNIVDPSLTRIAKGIEERKVPNMFYFVKTENYSRRLVTNIFSGMTALRLHMLCEFRGEMHVVEDQMGCEMMQIDNQAVTSLAPYMGGFMKLLTFSLKIGAHVAAGMGNLIPDLSKAVASLTDNPLVYGAAGVGVVGEVAAARQSRGRSRDVQQDMKAA
nr:protein TORNADO 1 [Tanacetum cinerariifolium]